MDALVRRGLRAQVQTGNILTGELVVALDLFPASPPATLDTAGPVPELPTEPNVLDTATRSLTGLMESLSKAPIGETVEELRAAVHAAGTLLGGPATTQAVASLSTTLVELDKTMRTVSGEAGPMIRALRQASESVAAIGTEAEATLKSTNRVIGSAQPVVQDLNGLLRELSSAARSIRVFADYLERHPEALIQGKRR
jgi:paraquat-inducible protein B